MSQADFNVYDRMDDYDERKEKIPMENRLFSTSIDNTLKMETFWMIWSPGNMGPTMKHMTFGAAKDEAERLARKHSGQSFFVLKAVARCIKQDVMWETYGEE